MRSSGWREVKQAFRTPVFIKVWPPMHGIERVLPYYLLEWRYRTKTSTIAIVWYNDAIFGFRYLVAIIVCLVRYVTTPHTAGPRWKTHKKTRLLHTWYIPDCFYHWVQMQSSLCITAQQKGSRRATAGGIYLTAGQPTFLVRWKTIKQYPSLIPSCWLLMASASKARAFFFLFILTLAPSHYHFKT